VNYKAHNDLSWFRPLLRGNSLTSIDFDIEHEQVLRGGEQRVQEVCMVKGGNGSRTPCLKGRGPFIDLTGVC
jgi:hypothetical protein